MADAAFRRALNAAIDRDALVRDIFEGHGAPAEGAVWPHHWAFAANLPRLQYDPEALDARSGPHRFKCLFVDPSHERLALAIQRQLQAIGVELELEMLPGSQVLSRLQSGDFDAILADFVQGPNLVRPYLFWHSGGPVQLGPLPQFAGGRCARRNPSCLQRRRLTRLASRHSSRSSLTIPGDIPGVEGAGSSS